MPEGLTINNIPLYGVSRNTVNECLQEAYETCRDAEDWLVALVAATPTPEAGATPEDEVYRLVESVRLICDAYADAVWTRNLLQFCATDPNRFVCDFDVPSVPADNRQQLPL